MLFRHFLHYGNANFADPNLTCVKVDLKSGYEMHIHPGDIVFVTQVYKDGYTSTYYQVAEVPSKKWQDLKVPYINVYPAYTKAQPQETDKESIAVAICVAWQVLVMTSMARTATVSDIRQLS